MAFIANQMYQVVTKVLHLTKLLKFVERMMVSLFFFAAMYRHGYDQFFEHHCMKYTSLIITSPHAHSQHTGGRLCTGAEMLDRCTAGTGCSLNKALVWACSANSSSCTASAECCSGLCNEGICEDVNGPDTSSPSSSPTKEPTLAVSSHCMFLLLLKYILSLMYLCCIYHP